MSLRIIFLKYGPAYCQLPRVLYVFSALLLRPGIKNPRLLKFAERHLGNPELKTQGKMNAKHIPGFARVLLQILYYDCTCSAAAVANAYSTVFTFLMLQYRKQRNDNT